MSVFCSECGSDEIIGLSVLHVEYTSIPPKVLQKVKENITNLFCCEFHEEILIC